MGNIIPFIENCFKIVRDIIYIFGRMKRNSKFYLILLKMIFIKRIKRIMKLVAQKKDWQVSRKHFSFHLCILFCFSTLYSYLLMLLKYSQLPPLVTDAIKSDWWQIWIKVLTSIVSNIIFFQTCFFSFVVNFLSVYCINLVLALFHKVRHFHSQFKYLFRKFVYHLMFYYLFSIVLRFFNHAYFGIMYEFMHFAV